MIRKGQGKGEHHRVDGIAAVADPKREKKAE